MPTKTRLSSYRNKPSLMDNVSTFSVTTNASSTVTNNDNLLHDDTTYTSTSSIQMLKTTRNTSSNSRTLAYSADETTTDDDYDGESMLMSKITKRTSMTETKQDDKLTLDDVGYAMRDVGNGLWNAIENFIGVSPANKSDERYNDGSSYDSYDETTVFTDDGSTVLTTVASTLISKKNTINTINDSKCQTIYEEDVNNTTSTADEEQRDEYDYYPPKSNKDVTDNPTTFSDVFSSPTSTSVTRSMSEA